MEGQTPDQLTEDQINALTEKAASKESVIEKGGEQETLSPSGEQEQESQAGAKKEDPLSSRFAALAKREKSLVKMRQELAEEKARIEAEKQEIARYRQIYEEAKKDPRKLLQEVGWDYDRLTNAHLNDFEETPDREIKTVKEEIEALKAQLQAEKEAMQKAQEEKSRQEHEFQIQQAKETIAQEIRSFGDEFELINTFDEHEMVFETMMEHFKKTGRMMEVKEAATLVENYIETQELERLAKTKKFQEKYLKAQKEGAEKPAPSSVTLSNSNTASPLGFTGPKTEQERIQRALAALERRK